MTDHVLVVGAQRCGTTYLYRVLDEHPEIAMAKPARPEPKFFLDAEKCRKGLAWYEATYFAGAEDLPVHGEKSTSYIESPEAAERAAAMIPDAHALVMLRDPIDHAISNWRFSTESGLENRPLEQALTENLERPQPWDRSRFSVSPFAYLEPDGTLITSRLGSFCSPDVCMCFSSRRSLVTPTRSPACTRGLRSIRRSVPLV